VPVYGILCDGDVFEFFRFDGSTKPASFHHGHTALASRLRLPDLTNPEAQTFIHALRPICEIIFDLMLKGYISSLEAYRGRSVTNSAKEGKGKV
jgi:hypothetical protein